jgi:hypothetical protein
MVDNLRRPLTKEDARTVAGVPDDHFTFGFFVQDWNSCIYLAAKEASLEWSGEPYAR